MITKTIIRSTLVLCMATVLFACKQKAKETEKATEIATEEVEAENYGGLALYTLRDNMGEDVDGTLQAVADAGYAYVEAAGYEDGKFYGLEPEAFKTKLEGMGLTPLSTHQGSVTLDNADEMIADVKAAGFTYFVVPVPPMGMFTFDRETRTLGMNGTIQELTDILNTLGEKCSAAGLQLLYHNHDFEFKADEAGVVPIDYLLENVNPEHVNFQMDLYWVTKAEADPLAYFDKYPGRFKGWHVKDMDDQGRFAPVGQGNIDFARILAQKEKSGMEFYCVEQDQTFDGLEPLEAIKISREGLKKFGFE